LKIRKNDNYKGKRIMERKYPLHIYCKDAQLCYASNSQNSNQCAVPQLPSQNQSHRNLHLTPIIPNPAASKPNPITKNISAAISVGFTKYAMNTSTIPATRYNQPTGPLIFLLACLEDSPASLLLTLLLLATKSPLYDYIYAEQDFYV